MHKSKPFNSIVFGKVILVEFVCLSCPISTQKERPSYRFRRNCWKAQPKCAKIGRLNSRIMYDDSGWYTVGSKRAIRKIVH